MLSRKISVLLTIATIILLCPASVQSDSLIRVSLDQPEGGQTKFDFDSKGVETFEGIKPGYYKTLTVHVGVVTMQLEELHVGQTELAGTSNQMEQYASVSEQGPVLKLNIADNGISYFRLSLEHKVSIFFEGEDGKLLHAFESSRFQSPMNTTSHRQCFSFYTANGEQVIKKIFILAESSVPVKIHEFTIGRYKRPAKQLHRRQLAHIRCDDTKRSNWHQYLRVYYGMIHAMDANDWDNFYILRNEVRKLEENVRKYC